MSFVDWKDIASVQAAKHYAISVVCGHWQEDFGLLMPGHDESLNQDLKLVLSTWGSVPLPDTGKTFTVGRFWELNFLRVFFHWGNNLITVLSKKSVRFFRFF